MIRTEAQQETRERAPSHSPPDTRYAPGLKLARGLGWFSLALGAAELLAPDLIAEGTGVRDRRLMRLVGLREAICGIGILTTTRPGKWLWARSAGDLLDLAALGETALRPRRRGVGTAIGIAAVAGALAADIATAAVQCTSEATEF
jgi:hypothetical protein